MHQLNTVINALDFVIRKAQLSLDKLSYAQSVSIHGDDATSFVLQQAELELKKLVHDIGQDFGYAEPMLETLKNSLRQQIAKAEDAKRAFEVTGYVVHNVSAGYVDIADTEEHAKSAVKEWYSNGWDKKSDVEGDEAYVYPVFDGLGREIQIEVKTQDIEMRESYGEEETWVVKCGHLEDAYSSEDYVKEAVLDLLNDGNELEDIEVTYRKEKTISLDSIGEEEIEVTF